MIKEWLIFTLLIVIGNILIDVGYTHFGVAAVGMAGYYIGCKANE